eukprot:GILI01066364.1.p1 GENE.GILI01066364.1~~GILI01066364.1.p1  ORF type:complete len:154 (+),score=6.12 GILI01066364.1:322-783(+)
MVVCLKPSEHVLGSSQLTKRLKKKQSLQQEASNIYNTLNEADKFGSRCCFLSEYLRKSQEEKLSLVEWHTRQERVLLAQGGIRLKRDTQTSTIRDGLSQGQVAVDFLPQHGLGAEELRKALGFFSEGLHRFGGPPVIQIAVGIEVVSCVIKSM